MEALPRPGNNCRGASVALLCSEAASDKAAHAQYCRVPPAIIDVLLYEDIEKRIYFDA